MTFENGIDSNILNINRVITSSPKQILFTYHITSLHEYPQKATNYEQNKMSGFLQKRISVFSLSVTIAIIIIDHLMLRLLRKLICCARLSGDIALNQQLCQVLPFPSLLLFSFLHNIYIIYSQ